jgi:hypothetical protein
MARHVVYEALAESDGRPKRGDPQRNTLGLL